MIPDTIVHITQYPIMSLALSPTTPSNGRAQKGWIWFVQPSPHAKAMTVCGMLALIADAAFIMTGPCMAHCPPPEGTNILTSPAARNVIIGNVVGVAIFTNHRDRLSTIPDPTIMLDIPAYNGNWTIIPFVAVIALATAWRYCIGVL